MAEEVNKLVKGDEEEESFVDYLLVNKENPDTRLEPESRKESPTEKVNDDDDDQHNNDALIRMKKKRSSDIREEEKQTLIPTPSRSPRTNVSLDKEQTDVHMFNFHPNPNPSMQNISQVAQAQSESHRHNVFRKRDHDDHSNDNAPHEGQNGTKKQKISRGSRSLKDSLCSKQPAKESQATSSEQQQKHDYDAWYEIPELDEDEEVSEEASPTFLKELKSLGDRKVLTIADHERMKAILKDMLSNRFKDAEEYAYYIKQAINYMKNHIVWESREKDLIIPKKEAPIFYRPQRDPNEPPRWVRKEFKTFNKEARLSIQHWKHTWHKIVYINKHKKERSNPKKVYSDHKIVEVVRIRNEHEHGQDFMEEIIAKRDNNKAYIFFETDYKYLNKEQKKQKRLMGLREISKFCDATLEKVLKEVSVIACVALYKLKEPSLDELDTDIMELFEKKIKKHLKHRRQENVGKLCEWKTNYTAQRSKNTRPRLHGNAVRMPYDVSKTRGNGETRETSGKRPQEKGKCFYNYGGARRFELTGGSIIENVLKEYPNADLFLNSPLDENSFKFSTLKLVSRIGGIRIFKPEVIPETDEALRVLTASNSPNGIQGLLQYFNLVEGCLTMINSHQQQNNFTYDWIIRTRVDGFWSTQLQPDLFIPGQYVVPSGSSYGGLNDRFGIGDYNTTTTALSRLSMIPELDNAGLHELNSESAFQAQLKLRNVSYLTKRIPFCIVSDRTYDFPPGRFGVPVAALSSKGPLSGVKCRPCRSSFSSKWAEMVLNGLDRQWSWTESANGTLQLCDGHDKWEDGWEDLFDRVAGKKLTAIRKRVWKLSFDECVKDFEIMKRLSAAWDVPPTDELCRYDMLGK
ncbi:hypothetical protein Tco_0729687 [Tanacetum coccineum]|uniref:DUF7796 domain-containing protein n=1 Tax=Tanacetum coccineum TaxID=301880 RepID=A0ABQ4YQS3_9ASTR